MHGIKTGDVTMFIEYLSALLQHWVALMTGIVSLVIGLWLRFGKVNIESGPDIPNWAFFSITVICIFISGYQAWADKNTTLLALQKKLQTPELPGEITQASRGMLNNIPLIAVSGIIRNPLGPPTGLINWHTYVHFPSGQTIQGQFPLNTGKGYSGLLLNSGGMTITFPQEKYWPEMCMQPISTGGAVNGWIVSTFSDLDLVKASKSGALLIVEFHDAVTNSAHTIQYQLNKLGGVNLPDANLPRH
jgi:hypothetical protein